jgi:hypothetical protein
MDENAWKTEKDVARSVAKATDLGNEIAEVSARITTAEHRLLTLIRSFDERRGWEFQGAKSCADWLSHRLGLDMVTAREKVRVARALGRLSQVDEAFRRGAISYSKVRALSRVATPDNEEVLLQCAKEHSGARLERVCKTYQRIVEPLDDGRLPPDVTLRSVTSHSAGFGWVRIEAYLPADEAALVLKALDVVRFDGAREVWRQEARGAEDESRGVANSDADDSAESSRGDGEDGARRPPTEKQRAFSRADALVALAQSALEAGSVAQPSSPRYEVVMNVDAATLRGGGEALATLDDGEGIPPEMARRVACDAGLVEVAVGESGDLLDVGRRTRTIPPSIRRALRRRDNGCRFPGCQHDHFVDGHHIVHWADGGETKLSNLVLLCRHHHRLVHEGGFSVQMNEGRPVFHDPRGQQIPEVPPPTPLPEDELGMKGFLAWQEREGLGDLGGGFSTGRWGLGSAIEALLAAKRSTKGRVSSA